MTSTLAMRLVQSGFRTTSSSAVRRSAGRIAPNHHSAVSTATNGSGSVSGRSFAAVSISATRPSPSKTTPDAIRPVRVTRHLSSPTAELSPTPAPSPDSCQTKVSAARVKGRACSIARDAGGALDTCRAGRTLRRQGDGATSGQTAGPVGARCGLVIGRTYRRARARKPAARPHAPAAPRAACGAH